MPRKLEQVLAKLPTKRRAEVQQRVAELATLDGLGHAVERTREQIAEPPRQQKSSAKGPRTGKRHAAEVV